MFRTRLRLGIISALLLLTPQCFALKCRTCTGEECQKEDVEMRECTKFSTMLPSEACPLSSKQRENLLYACLKLEYQDGMLEKCIITEDVDKVCENIAKRFPYANCAVEPSSSVKTTVSEINDNSPNIQEGSKYESISCSSDTNGPGSTTESTSTEPAIPELLSTPTSPESVGTDDDELFTTDENITPTEITATNSEVEMSSKPTTILSNSEWISTKFEFSSVSTNIHLLESSTVVQSIELDFEGTTEDFIETRDTTDHKDHPSTLDDNGQYSDENDSFTEHTPDFSENKNVHSSLPTTLSGLDTTKTFEEIVTVKQGKRNHTRSSDEPEHSPESDNSNELPNDNHSFTSTTELTPDLKEGDESSSLLTTVSKLGNTITHAKNPSSGSSTTEFNFGKTNPMVTESTVEMGSTGKENAANQTDPSEEYASNLEELIDDSLGCKAEFSFILCTVSLFVIYLVV